MKCILSILSDEAKKLMINIKQLDNWFDTAQLICTNTDGKTKYDFSNFTFPSKLASKMYNKDFTLQEAKDNQIELKILINKLNKNYNPKNKIKMEEKRDTLKSAEKLFFIREEIIRTFKRGIFPYIDGFKVQKESDEELDEESDENENIDTTDMSDLESEKSINGKGLKILTPNQMLSRLPIALAQLKAGNNSEKPKNEIRQLLYSLYRSKNLTKQLYKSLIDII